MLPTCTGDGSQNSHSLLGSSFVGGFDDCDPFPSCTVCGLVFRSHISLIDPPVFSPSRLFGVIHPQVRSSQAGTLGRSPTIFLLKLDFFLSFIHRPLAAPPPDRPAAGRRSRDQLLSQPALSASFPSPPVALF